MVESITIRLIGVVARWNGLCLEGFQTLLRFGFGRIQLQAAQFFTGMCVLWIVPIETYGQYVLALSCMSTFMAFADAGVTATLIPLAGKQQRDKQRLGQLTVAVFFWRKLFFPISMASWLYVTSC